jgi:hypothetical protein
VSKAEIWNMKQNIRLEYSAACTHIFGFATWIDRNHSAPKMKSGNPMEVERGLSFSQLANEGIEICLFPPMHRELGIDTETSSPLEASPTVWSMKWHVEN